MEFLAVHNRFLGLFWVIPGIPEDSGKSRKIRENPGNSRKTLANPGTKSNSKEQTVISHAVTQVNWVGGLSGIPSRGGGVIWRSPNRSPNWSPNTKVGLDCPGLSRTLSRIVSDYYYHLYYYQSSQN